MLDFSNLIDTLFHRLCPDSLDVPGRIIVDDSGDLRGPIDVLIGRKPTQRSELNKLIKVLRVISTDLVTLWIPGITPGSSTLLSSINQ